MYKKLVAVIVFTLLALVFSANADIKTATDCIPQSEIKTIASHFTQFADLANADFCNDNSKNWHLLAAIMFMRKTQFSPTMRPSQDELFSGRFSMNWYDYFIGRIESLEVVEDCEEGVIAYVFGLFGKTMFICEAALTDRYSALDIASVMMHEARHIDGYPHITCTNGPRKGLSGSCDAKISDGGSYAVTVETYAQLAEYAEGIHPALRAYAKSSAVTYAEEAFETPVKINRSEYLLILTDTLDFYSLNIEKNESKKLGRAFARGRIIKKGQDMIILPRDKELKVEHIFANNEGLLAQSPTNFISKYNAQPLEQKENLVDLHFATQWDARIYKNKVTLVCDPYLSTGVDIQLPNGLIAAGLIYPDGYATDKYTTHLVTESSEVFEIGCINRQASLKSSSFKVDRKYLRIYKVANQVLGLAADSKLYRLEEEGSTPVFTPFDGRIIEIVPQQSFEFFDRQVVE